MGKSITDGGQATFVFTSPYFNLRISDVEDQTNAVADVFGRVVPLIRPAYRIGDVTNAISLLAPGQARVAVNQPRTVGLEFRFRYLCRAAVS